MSNTDIELIRAQSPNIYQNMLNFNRRVQDYKNASATRGPDDVILIPVVVHIVWNTNAQNLSVQRIQSQIDVLNEDFSRMNADATSTPLVFQPVAANSKIQFKLACINSTGGTTTGIVRTQTTLVEFDPFTNPTRVQSSAGLNQEIGSDPWDTKKYLNIWVCNNKDKYSYGYIPDVSTFKDGIVVHYEFFGRNNGFNGIINKSLGRVCTHEVGHWLSCLHIYNQRNCTEGTDFCGDTPNQYPFNSGCPIFPHPSCTNSDMFMNYMDYTNDDCQNLFTNDQKARMRTLFEPGGIRYSIVNNNNALNRVTRSYQPQGGSQVMPLKKIAEGLNDIIGGTSSSYTPIFVDDCDKSGPVSWRIVSSTAGADIVIIGENASLRFTSYTSTCVLEATIPRYNGGTKVEMYSFTPLSIPNYELSPNPAANRVQIQQKVKPNDTQLLTDPFSAKMYNLNNQLVRTGQGINGQLEFDVANLPIGNYQVIIEKSGKFVTKKVNIHR